MKILHLVNTLNPRGGGVTEAVKQFSVTLTESGHKNEIVTVDSQKEKWGDLDSIPIHRLGPAKSAYGYSEKLIPWLREHGKRFDLAITHGLWQYHGPATRKVFLELGRPYFVFAHGMLDVWFKTNYPLKHLKKWLFWPWADYRVMRDAKSVIYTSDNEMISSRKSFWLYRCHESVVRYGIMLPHKKPEEAEAAFLEKYPELKGQRFLLFIGRIHEKKGLDLLCKAWAEIDPEKRPPLVVAGPEEQTELLKTARALAGPDGFHYLGMLDNEVKWGAMAAAEVMILPSHQENFGLVVAETMIMGTPVLISDKVNIWKEATESGAGLVAPDTLEGTRILLDSWLEMTHDQRDSMATCAQPACESLFDLRKNTAALIEVLKS